MSKSILRFAPVMMIALLLGGSFAEAQEGQDWTALDRYIQTSMKEWNVPGVAVAIVHDHSVAYMKGFGVRDLETGQPVTADTLFDIGSCTKAFTTASIAMLVDEGKLQWDTKVNRALPFFHLSDALADENVTIRDLLTHRTGVPEIALSHLGQSPFTRDEWVRKLGYMKPNAGFRTVFQYNNMMYVSAGDAVGKISGGTWEEFVQRRIFAPLGMNESDLSAIDAQKAPDHASPHTKGADGKVNRIPWSNIDVFAPAGALNSNLRDMTKWIAFQLGNGKVEGKQLISNNNMREMHTPQMVISPEGEIPEVFFPDSMQLSYGLGWFIEFYHGHRLIVHPGDVPGFASIVVLIPELHTGYVVLINSRSFYRQVLNQQIADTLLHLPEAGWSEHFKKLEQETEALAKKEEAALEAERNPQARPSHELSVYAGTYHNSVVGDANVGLEGGKLLLNFNGTSVAMNHFQYDTFIVNWNGKTRLTFRLNADGKVSEFVAAGMEFERSEDSHN